MKTNIIFLVIALATTISCKKDKTNTLPGDPNYLNCKVNGTLHTYTGVLNTSGFTAGVFSREKGIALDTLHEGYSRVTIAASDQEHYHDDLFLYIATDNYAGPSFQTPQLNRSYPLTNHMANSEYVLANGDQTPAYIADTTRSFVTFTRFDSKVISGNFEFYGTKPGNKTVAITEGEFKVSY